MSIKSYIRKNVEREIENSEKIREFILLEPKEERIERRVRENLVVVPIAFVGIGLVLIGLLCSLLSFVFSDRTSVKGSVSLFEYLTQLPLFSLSVLSYHFMIVGVFFIGLFAFLFLASESKHYEKLKQLYFQKTGRNTAPFSFLGYWFC